MSEFIFEQFKWPFPRWLGPYSPARGAYYGFRLHYSRLGVWKINDDWEEFWPMEQTAGGRKLEDLILRKWGGGRVLFLPDGHVIKPLQEEYEKNIRVVIGKFSGNILLKMPNGGLFDMSDTTKYKIGGEWRGPKSTGIECTIRRDGSLITKWINPTPFGVEELTERVCGYDFALAMGFRNCRGGKTIGRVRVTSGGLVITNKKLQNGEWQSRYVGKIDVNKWPSKAEWIQNWEN